MMQLRGRKWSELTKQQRAGVLTFVVLQAALTAFVQRDLGMRSSDEVRGPKVLWRLLALNSLGAVAYVVVARRPS